MRLAVIFPIVYGTHVTLLYRKPVQSYMRLHTKAMLFVVCNRFFLADRQLWHFYTVRKILATTRSNIQISVSLVCIVYKHKEPYEYNRIFHSPAMQMSWLSASLTKNSAVHWTFTPKANLGIFPHWKHYDWLDQNGWFVETYSVEAPFSEWTLNKSLNKCWNVDCFDTDDDDDDGISRLSLNITEYAMTE